MRFNTGVLIACLAGVPLVAGGSLAGVGSQPSSDYIEIDGSKNPEQVPAWVAWETSFRVLALARRKGSMAVPESLEMSEAERQLVFHAAEGQAGRDAMCEERVMRLKPLLGREKVEVLNEKTRAIQLDCRQAVLDARDQLLRSLSPEAQAALIIWVETRKAGIRSWVPRAELDHYRRPD